MNIFARYQLREQKEETVVESVPCPLALCDGSGLREVESTWFGGVHLVKCECKKNV